ncbi:MAG: cell wall-binding repeat-containing protein [Desulfosporosinus sp.]|nr:cell wall-binding repeat-containing protein [Desulfosporosinus sp.]
MKKYDATNGTWSAADAGSLNYSTSNSASNPRLINYNGTLYLVWEEATYNDSGYMVPEIRMRRYDGGTAWSFADGGSASGLNRINNMDAHYPALTVSDNKLFISWEEVYYDSTSSQYRPQIRVANYDGTTRTFIDGDNSTGLNYDPTYAVTNSQYADNSSIAVNNGRIFTAWREKGKLRVKAINPPAFVGATTSLTVGQNSTNNDLKELLHVNDTDTGQTLIWSQSAAPAHGTLSFSSATAASGTADITPGGTITYTPTEGYIGSDSFTVQVGDGTTTAIRTVNVTVAAADITASSITGVVAPVTGATPISMGALATTDTTYSITSITWQNSDGSDATLSGGKFDAGSTYQAQIALTSTAGSKFPAAGLTPTVDAGTGGAGTVAGGDVSGNTLTFVVTFPATAPPAPTDISAAGVSGFVAPATSNAPQVNTALTAGSAGYTVSGLSWSPSDNPFQALTAYTATVTLTSAAGYEFPAGGIAVPTADGGGSISAGITSGSGTGNTLTFTVQFPAIPLATYSISINSLTGGSITASPMSATSGTAINLTITPDSGMQMKVGSLKYNDGTTDTVITGTGFTMPAANVTVLAQFEAIPASKYSISINSLTGGSITASPMSATSGTAINLTITPDSGMQLKAGTLKYNDGTTDTVITGRGFTMPAANVTVLAQFEAIPASKYSISINSLTGGSITASPMSATSGTAINLTITPDSGMQLKVGSLKYNDGTTDTVITGTGFTMPAANVTVSAQFEAIPNTTGGGGGGSSSGGGSVSGGGTTVTGGVINGNGTQVSNVTATVTADSNGNYTVSMNAAQTVTLQQPNGTMSSLSDLSKVTFVSEVGSFVTVSADGTINLQNLAKGTDNNFNITYDLGNGQTIRIGTMEVTVSSSGAVSLTCTLIDPYGVIIDAATGKPIVGANVTLYYANTDRNKTNGKTPDTVVALPGINGFKPNNNQDPQTSDVSGAYGFMVFPTADYYIVATKDGYNNYTSPTISVEQDIVKWDFKMSTTTSGIQRLAGLSRVDTALAIAKANYTGTLSSAILATADNYPDALAGSVLAYKLNAPILLVGRSDDDQAKVLEYMKANLNQTGTVYILGGTSVVSSAMEGKITTNGFANIIRLGGTDRYDTSAKIADQVKVKTGTPIVLAYGENYPDALSISSIAAEMQYPILLVQKDGLSNVVKNEIAAIKPTKVYIVGGEGIISKSVESQVAEVTSSAKVSIIRIAGKDRYETSLAVAQYFNLSGNVCIATGNNFPDALAGSVYAANHNAPIILADGSLSDQVMNYLKGKKQTGVTLFGGEAVVSKDIEQQLGQLMGK